MFDIHIIQAAKEKKPLNSFIGVPTETLQYLSCLNRFWTALSRFQECFVHETISLIIAIESVILVIVKFWTTDL